jgi:hypothetical protein
MDAKEREWLDLTFSLVVKHHDLLAEVLPVIQDIVTTLQKGQPSPAQLDAWQEHYRAFDQKLHGLTGAFESVRQFVDPTFRFDA